MNAEQLLSEVEAAHPEVMQKTAAAIRFLEKVSPGHAEDLVRDIGLILEYTSEKVAGAERGYGPLALWGAAAVGTAASGLLNSVATDLYDAAKRTLTKGGNYRRIMQANPELAPLAKADKTRFKASFDAIHRYAPEFTADPIIGGTLLKAVVENPGNEATVIKDLVSARNNLQNAKHTQYRPGSVSLELSSSADIAENEAKRNHDVMLANQRNDVEFRKAQDERNWKNQQRILQEEAKLRQGKIDFRRQARLTRYRAMVERSLGAKGASQDPVR